MVSFPIRKNENMFSKDLLLSSGGKKIFFLYVEDCTSKKVYEHIVKKFLPKHYSVRVTSLNSKLGVLSLYSLWEKLDDEKVNETLFVVDKDFDMWKQNYTGIVSNNFLELPCYTLENLFFTPETAEILLGVYARSSESDNYDTEFWDLWMRDICKQLEYLFICFVIIVKNNLDITNCSRGPGAFILEDSNKELKINTNLISVIENDIKDKLNVELFDNEIDEIRKHYTSGDNVRYAELIKGKYLLYGLIRYIRLITGNRSLNNPIDAGNFAYLAATLTSKNFVCFGNKIELLINKTS